MAKTVELIHENVHVEVVRDDLDTLVMDADVLEDLLRDPEPDRKAKEVELKTCAGSASTAVRSNSSNSANASKHSGTATSRDSCTASNT